MIFQIHFEGELGSYSYLLANQDGREAVVIDPVPDCLDGYEELCAQLDWKLRAALLTGGVTESAVAAAELARDGTFALAPDWLADGGLLMTVRSGQQVAIAGLVLEVLAAEDAGEAVAYRLEDRVFTGAAAIADSAALSALAPETLVYRSIPSRGTHVGLIGLELPPLPRDRQAWRHRGLQTLAALVG